MGKAPILKLAIPKPVIILAYLILFGWAIIAIFPLYWMFTTAFRKVTLIFSVSSQIIPHPVTFENFAYLFRAYFAWRWTFNSIVVSTVATIPYLFFCNLAGYVLAKKRFPGRSLFFWLIIGTMMIPWQVMVVPLFLIIAKFGLVNTYAGLILPLLIGPYGIFLMKQFIQSLPGELIEAAKIDGCSEFGILWRIIIPLSKPAWGVLGILGFVGNWNLFLWPLIITNTNEMETLQIGISTLTAASRSGVTDYGLIMAGASFAAIPVIIVFLSFQKYFLKGITVGALKG